MDETGEYPAGSHWFSPGVYHMHGVFIEDIIKTGFFKSRVIKTD